LIHHSWSWTQTVGITARKCQKEFHDEKAKTTGQSFSLGKLKSRSVTFTILVHPIWLEGEANDSAGKSLGGTNTDTPGATVHWNELRSKKLALIEVRGTLPDVVVCPLSGTEIKTGAAGGNIPRKSTFACGSCGREQDVLDSIKASDKSGPMGMYAVQCYCPTCHADKTAFSGRYFDYPNARAFDTANVDWVHRKDSDLSEFWPRCELSQGWKTHGWSIPQHGYSHYWKMFNERQLLTHALLLRSIVTLSKRNDQSGDVLIGVFQQYLRNQNMFCFWNNQRALEPMFSNNNYHPKMCVVENSVFSGLGRGDFRSSGDKLLESLNWCTHPWEIVCTDGSGHSQKMLIDDGVNSTATLTCRSASELTCLESESIDLIVTDPPFGEIMQYAELSDFFYVWLRLALRDKHQAVFDSEYTPKVLEAVSNPNRHSEPDAFYQRILTECWREAVRGS
jgi:putative DNA methylase